MIDLTAIAANYKLIRDKVGPACAVAAAVKADAYGLGAAQVVPVLDAAGCPFFFTASADEAHTVCGLTTRKVAALHGPSPDFVEHNIIPVLNSLGDIEAWHAQAAQAGRTLPAILHFDTGINRLGIPADETARLLDDPALTDGLEIVMVMSHAACADEADHPLTARQWETFTAITRHFPRAQKSFANSSALFRDARYHADMVRPGMALYGLNPVPEQPNPMSSVIRLDVPLLQIKTVRKGDSIGYGAGDVCTVDASIGIVEMGYADGFFRSLGTRHGTLYHRGRPCPVRGRVSMDLTALDLGAAPDARPGEMIEVIGPYQSADVLASAAGTIGYEILTALGRRYRRVYANGMDAPGKTF